MVSWLLKMNYLLVKRLLDLTLALMLVLLTLPLQVVLAIGVALVVGPAHVLYVRPRVGRNGLVFSMLKFTTLRPVAPDLEHEVTAERTFWLGIWMRRLVLDELPQLYHILAGQMSFIGPRPLLPDYLPYYTATEKKRHLVLPGITGWAQVQGGNACSWNQRLLLDVYYVEHLSLALDLKIMALSIRYLYMASRKDEPLAPTRLDVERRLVPDHNLSPE